MSTTLFESRSSTSATAYGGVIDAIGGIAAAVIAIVGLTGYHAEMMAAIATIVFGAALLIEGGTLLTEYASVMPSAGTTDFSDSGVSLMFLGGVAGMVLGILALLGIATATFTSISVIVFGAALVLASSSVRHLFMLQSAARRTMARSGSEMIAGEMASGSSGVHLLAGMAAIVLGVLAVCGTRTPVLTLSALLIVGVTLILTGSTLSGLVMSFMHQEQRTPRVPL